MASNREVFQAFAEGQEAEGGSVRSRKTHTGALVLYSYSTPVAYRGVGQPFVGVVFDARTYSVTTSKQVAQAKREFPSLSVFVREHKAFRDELQRHGADLSYAR